MDTLQKLEAIEEIKQLRARYWRIYDNHIMGEIGELFAEDAWFDSGEAMFDPVDGYMNNVQPAPVAHSREEIVKYLEKSMSSGVQSAHMGHTAEVEILSETTAKAIHPFNDRLRKPGFAFTGYGYYYDTYEKIDGQWKIKTSTIKRLRVVFGE